MIEVVSRQGVLRFTGSLSAEAERIYLLRKMLHQEFVLDLIKFPFLNTPM